MAASLAAATAAATEYVMETNNRAGLSELSHAIFVGLKDKSNPDNGYEIKIHVKPRFKPTFGKIPIEFKGISVTEVNAKGIKA